MPYGNLVTLGGQIAGFCIEEFSENKEEAKNIASATRAGCAVAGAACDFTGTSVAGAAVVVAKEVTDIAMRESKVEDAGVVAAVNAGFSVVGSVVTMNPTGAISTAAGAATGAAAAAIAEAEGVEGASVSEGLTMGASLGAGSLKEGVMKTAGAGIGAAVGAAAADASGGNAMEAAKLGFSTGASLGGATSAVAGGNTTTGDSDVKDLQTESMISSQPLNASAPSPSGPAHNPNVEFKADVAEWASLGIKSLGAAGASAAIHAAADEEGEADVLASIRAGNAVANTASGLAGSYLDSGHQTSDLSRNSLPEAPQWVSDAEAWLSKGGQATNAIGAVMNLRSEMQSAKVRKLSQAAQGGSETAYLAAGELQEQKQEDARFSPLLADLSQGVTGSAKFLSGAADSLSRVREGAESLTSWLEPEEPAVPSHLAFGKKA